MAAPYSQDLRDRVLAAYDRGMPTKEIAEVFGVSRAWARRLKQRRRQSGETAPRPMGGATVVKIDMARLAELVREQPDATLRELRERLNHVCGEPAICLALQRLKLTFKETLHASEQDRPDVRERRERWRENQGELDGARLIFLDETWAKTNMTRLRGRAPRGARLVAKVPHGHWKTTTLIAALGIGGVRCAMVLDGAIDRGWFEAFVEDILVHELKPGDVVILDNLSSHKSVRARRLIESRGAELVFLPPYSPDFNPIEMVFAKIKTLLRSLAHRTNDTLWKALQPVLDAVTPADATNCFRHCGYTLREG